MARWLSLVNRCSNPVFMNGGSLISIYDIPSFRDPNVKLQLVEYEESPKRLNRLIECGTDYHMESVKNLFIVSKILGFLGSRVDVGELFP